MNNLPEEVIWWILLFLDYKDLGKSFRISKQFSRISQSEMFWKEYFHCFHKKLYPKEEDVDPFYLLKPLERNWSDHFRLMIQKYKKTEGSRLFYPMQMMFVRFFVSKVLIVGESGVGKRWFLSKIMKEQISEKDVEIGKEYNKKLESLRKTAFGERIGISVIPQVSAKIKIFEKGNQTIATMVEKMSKSIRGITLYMLCFDITNKDSFENLENEWIQELNRCCTGCNYPNIILVGTKLDLVQKSNKNRAVTKEEAMNLARKYGLRYVEISSKENLNVVEIMERFLSEVWDLKVWAEKIQGNYVEGW